MASTCIIDSKGYRTLIKIIAIMMGIFQIVVAGYGFIVINMRCAIHLTFALTLIAMLKPVRFKSNLDGRLQHCFYPHLFRVRTVSYIRDPFSVCSAVYP